MAAHVTDYRVSTLVVMCKDCNKDVGLFPSRHRCSPNPDSESRTPNPSQAGQARRPNPAPSGVGRADTAYHASMDGDEKRSRLQHARSSPTAYRNDVEVSPSDNPAPPSGRKLWGKVRNNEKWKHLADKNESNGPNKLWGKLLQATQNLADKIPSRDDRGPESDESDWEGETHVSRILREHYEKKRVPLPDWLRDGSASHETHHGRTSKETDRHASAQEPSRAAPRKQRLWEQPTEDMSYRDREREREREILRSADHRPPRPAPSYRDEADRRYDRKPPIRPQRETPIAVGEPERYTPTPPAPRAYHDGHEPARTRPYQPRSKERPHGKYPGEYI